MLGLDAPIVKLATPGPYPATATAEPAAKAMCRCGRDCERPAGCRFRTRSGLFASTV